LREGSWRTPAFSRSSASGASNFARHCLAFAAPDGQDRGASSRGELRDARPCLVRADGGEWPGLLLAWQRTEHGWRGYVEYGKGVGMRHLGWFDAEVLAPR
jgi:hypothetical protein